MKTSFAPLHFRLFIFLALLITSVLAGTFHIGEFKPAQEIEIIDLVGEGAITLVTLIWIIVTLISRPAGRVTNLLFIGLSAMHISMLVDCVDEFIQYPHKAMWISTIESIPGTVGMLIMSFALYQWHKEQVVINDTLRKKERHYREHKHADSVTGLYSADYMKNQIAAEIENQNAIFSLIMLDVRQFEQFTHVFGYTHGDMLLQDLATLMQLNLRRHDLVCRFASDRFIILLPNTSMQEASEIAQQITLSIQHLAHKPDDKNSVTYHRMYYQTLEYSKGYTSQTMLTKLSEQISIQKQQNIAA